MVQQSEDRKLTIFEFERAQAFAQLGTERDACSIVFDKSVESAFVFCGSFVMCRHKYTLTLKYLNIKYYFENNYSAQSCLPLL